MDTNTLLSVINDALPLIESAISGITGVLLTTFFLRHDTKTKQFEKIKAGKFQEVIDDMLANHQMTYVEYFKTRNYLKIAKLADSYYKKNTTDQTQQGDFDFDWFVRFFDAAGNVTNEHMQKLWASILAGKTRNPGSFSLRTIDILHNMSQGDATLFESVSKIILDRSFVFSLLDKVGQEVNEKHGFGNDELRLLEEIGLINGLRMESQLELDPKESGGFQCGSYLLLLTSKAKKTISVRYTCYTLTRVGHELYEAIYNDDGQYTYLYDLGKELQKHCAYLDVTLRKMDSEDEECISYSPEVDYLQKDRSSD